MSEHSITSLASLTSLLITGLSAGLQIHGTCSHIRAFALAVSTVWNILLHFLFALVHSSSLCSSTVCFNEVDDDIKGES